MHVSDEMLRKMVQVYRDSIGGIEESFAAALAVLPDMYTVEQVHAAIMAQGDTLGTWEFADGVIARLTQKTPAAQPVGAEVNGDLIYDSAQTPIPATTSFPDIKKEDKDFNVTQATPDAEPQELCGKPLGSMTPPLFCNRLKGHTGGCYITSKITVPAEPTITLAEHKAKMRELFEELMPMSDGLAYKEKLYRKYGLAELTPAERVTMIEDDSLSPLQSNPIWMVDGVSVSNEQIKAALVAQLKKETA